MFKTPVKQKPEKGKICIVCGTNSDRIRSIESKVNAEIGLKELLNKYGGISVESGILGRNCFQKLIYLDKKCREFYDLCQEKYVSVYSRGKRTASSPAEETAKRVDLKYAPVKAWNRLFDFPLDDEERTSVTIFSGELNL